MKPNWIDTLFFGVRTAIDAAGVTMPERPTVQFKNASIVDNSSENRLEIDVGAGQVPTTREIIAGAGLTGGGDLSANRTLDVVAADDSIVVTPDGIAVGVIENDAQHGNLGGGDLHAVADPSEAGTAGFMSGADKKKLDASTASATAGALVLRGASGEAAFGWLTVGTNPATAGALRGANNSVLVSARNAANTGNLSCLATDGSNNVLVGQQAAENGHLRLRTPTGGGIFFDSGATLLAFLDATGLDLRAAALLWGPVVIGPSIHQADQTVASTGGQPLTIHGQNATGVTSSGGDLILRSGTGTNGPGDVVLGVGATDMIGLSTGLINLLAKIQLPTVDPAVEGQVGTNAAGRLRVWVDSVARTVPTELEPWPEPPAPPTAGTANVVTVPARPYLIVRVDTTDVPISVDMPSAATFPGAWMLVVICAGPNEAECGGASAGKMNGVSSGRYTLLSGGKLFVSDGDSWWSI